MKTGYILVWALGFTILDWNKDTAAGYTMGLAVTYGTGIDIGYPKF